MEQAEGVSKACARNLEQWRDIVRENFLPLEFAKSSSRDFRSALIARRLGSAHLACVNAGAQRVMRTTGLASRSERGYFKLFWQLAGQSRVEQAGRVGELKPGDWTYYDTAQPYQIDIVGGSRFAVMLLPHEMCAGWITSAGVGVGNAFHASGAARAALASVMAALHDTQGYDGLAAESVVSSISSLIQTELGAHAHHESPSAMQERLNQACRYIVEHIDDSDLTPDEVASALGISRRTLYACFAQNGESPFAFIQKTRLETCRQRLIDPRGQRQTITRIVLDKGYTDITYFSRVFKATYGASPRDYRKRVLG